MPKNQENVLPYRIKSADEARTKGRAGGIKSGESKRRKRSMREWAEIIGAVEREIELPDGQTMSADYAAEVVLEQFRKAANGNTKAADFLMRLRGEEVQKHEIVDDEAKRAALSVEITKLYGIPTDAGQRTEDED